MSTQDIVQKLWNLCNVLRDDGITYHQYVTELTYSFFAYWKQLRNIGLCFSLMNLTRFFTRTGSVDLQRLFLKSRSQDKCYLLHILP